MNLPFDIYPAGPPQLPLVLSQSILFPDDFSFEIYPAGMVRSLFLPGKADLAFQLFSLDEYLLLICDYRVFRPVKLIFRNILPGFRLYFMEEGKLFYRDSPIPVWAHVKMNNYLNSNYSLKTRELRLPVGNYHYLIIQKLNTSTDISSFQGDMSLNMLLDIQKIKNHLRDKGLDAPLKSYVDDLVLRVKAKEQYQGHYLFSPKQVFDVYRTTNDLKRYVDEMEVFQFQTNKLKIDRKRYNEVFKYFWHMTPYQYILHLRLEKAQQLLLNGEKNIEEVAFTVGYTHPWDFVRAYSKYFNHPPRQDVKN